LFLPITILDVGINLILDYCRATIWNQTRIFFADKTKIAKILEDY